jgi:NAD dependent epimerase/dehydratase family enzyme
MDEAGGELGGNELIAKSRRAPDTWNFSIRVAKDWETAFFETPTPRTRKIAMRSSILFSAISGNAFTIFSNLVRIGLGGRQCSGRQFVSWIHDSDFARAVEFLITREDLAGPINIASPNPLPNREFMAILREAWDVPNGMPIPTPLLAIGAFFLRTETELVLKSRRVIPTRLQNAGFQFEFPNWPAAAADLVQRWKNRD